MFVHLHTHTEYSLLDGSNKIKEYVKELAAGNISILSNHPNKTFENGSTMKSFYNFYKDYQNRLILHIGDVVAVQKLASNTYYILEKVQKIEQ